MASEPLIPSQEGPNLLATCKNNMAALTQNHLITPPDPPVHDFADITSQDNKSNDPVLVFGNVGSLPPTPGMSRSPSQSSSSSIQGPGLFGPEPVSIPQPIPQPRASWAPDDYQVAVPLRTAQDYDLILQRFQRFREVVRQYPDEIYYVDEGMVPRERRLVRATELLNRLELFMKYRITWYEPGLGADTVWDPTSCSPGPWNSLKRLAFVGLLPQYPADDMDSVLLYIRNHLFNGRPSPLEWIPPESSLRGVTRSVVTARPGLKSKLGTTSERPPSRQATAPSPKEKKANIVHTVLEATGEPLSRTRGVKRNYQGEEESRMVSVKVARDQEANEVESIKSIKKSKVVPDSKPKTTQRGPDSKSKNTRTRNSDKPRGPSESLCRNIKDTLNRRSEDKVNYEAFKDAMLPENGPSVHLSPCEFTAEELKDIRELQDIGDCTGLHPEEVKLCKVLAMSSDLYKCQKARCFLGLALFVEYNLEKLGENNPKFKVLNVGKAQFQLFGNVDVNKLSKMYTTFKKWGWVEDMTQQNIPKSYIDRFPQTYRLALRDEVAEYEATLPLEKRIFRV
ncbi:uncharacterized protein Z519_06351 [Cladophialophora bantiana CBS 173.52]|uniref:SWIRM domain-containing protein n=1 Tax=Cladophialophora bantiana (strain ATCC 10958 / CBS 173.52 / CDC B-1940 / NIH 8579) TaxID=1442370 RepID=A0A0D2I6R6_CLAB1|nr:uncharacterized protein Z519_06351 [Cladophialophora bantiana CBS 173.52]KIW92504.1 hypothetical protein Z519_06351 [Cladophialophora bantiana CBS 173.52]